jgi:exodeoxyribonuclease VII large subunit
VATLDAAAHRVVARARSRSALAAQELDAAIRRVRRDAPAALVRASAHVERGHGRMQELGRRRTRDAAVMLRERERAMTAITARHLERATLRLDAAEGALRALDPRRVLERGYTITRTADGRIVRRAGDVETDHELVTELAHGQVTSRVVATAEDDDE